LTYGTPPHGGIALGIDRITMLLAGEKSLREVIAFAKTTAAQDLMAESPSTVDQDQLWDLRISLIPPFTEFTCECGGKWKVWAESSGSGHTLYMICPKTQKTYYTPPAMGRWRAEHRDAETGFAVEFAEGRTK
jgi:hypothetical protein